MNQFNEAVAFYNDGLKRLPKDCQLWQELGTVYATKGDVALALATLIKASPPCRSVDSTITKRHVCSSNKTAYRKLNKSLSR